LFAIAIPLVALSPALAQQPVLGLGPVPFSQRGPVMYGPTTFYGSLATYTGKPLWPEDSRLAFVSNYSSTYSPVFYTSINFPGIYGSYSFGVVASGYRTYPRLSLYPPAVTTPATMVAGIPPTDELPTPRASATPAPPAEDIAYVNVRVPPEATLWFQGVRMTKGGSVRDFVSPPLPVGKPFTYTARAIWMENGQEVSRERQIQVRAGDRVDIDFLLPETTEPPTLRTRPLPGLPSQPR
jgi:uncharacterized protein (TIGR03000 family)